MAVEGVAVGDRVVGLTVGDLEGLVVMEWRLNNHGGVVCAPVGLADVGGVVEMGGIAGVGAIVKV